MRQGEVDRDLRLNLDRNTPVNFVLDPGNYIVDITMSGYVPIHKVINVDKGGKAVIDEVMQHE